MKSYIAAFSIATLLFSSVASADPVFPNVQPVPGEQPVGAAVSPLKKGQVAPFTGVLLSPEAVAKVIVDFSNQKAQTDIEVAKARETQKAQDQLVIDNLAADLKREKDVAEAQVKSRDDQLNILNKRLEQAEKDKPNPLFWAGVGAGGGALVVILSVIAVGSLK